MAHRFDLPSKPRTSPGGIAIGIMILLGLLMGGIGTIYLLSQRNTPTAPEPQVVVQRKVILASTRPTTGKSPGELDTSDAPDPVAVAWANTQETYRTSPPEQGIMALKDFLDTHPNSPYIATAKSQIDQAMDRLWWVRINHLCKERDSLDQQIADIDKQIDTLKRNGGVGERISELQAEKGPLVNRAAVDRQHLAEMKYTDSRTPDLYSDEQLAELAKARDSDTFEEWKTQTLGYIIRNRGKLPW
jgi:hypothetical protein